MKVIPYQHDIVKSYKISVHTVVKNIVIAHMSAGNLVFPNKTLMKQSSKYSSKQSSEDPVQRRDINNLVYQKEWLSCRYLATRASKSHLEM